MARTTKQARRLQQVAPNRYEAGPWTATRCTYMGKYGRATGYEVTVSLAGLTITLSDPYSVEGPTAHTIDEADTLVRRFDSVMAAAVMAASSDDDRYSDGLRRALDNMPHRDLWAVAA